jgi:hypothetical protein
MLRFDGLPQYEFRTRSGRVAIDHDARAIATVPCGHCGACIGSLCVGARGRPVKHTHIGRRHAAAHIARTNRRTT